ncbi:MULTISPECIES: acetyl-CoA carboxylase biotin carboxyl carrier protein [Anoxybacillus]|uniref:Biotin carboxyl carrier protein of acetyl-CoA carboxylase n=1 Tax=Anoxybacillus mongoliensis TaxID=452565 RepID=A0A7W8N9A1_9BACL|nr:acetyl-CoA carboxylase biotin carboxyl carrier protein [Anoxybacillus mongoliensis]MBB5356383.1 acetyl-CoA carboxylase biotin carboxyl carrier protein [Anoxybacillus mongoliensis]MCX8002231.1 acetyl-CoA carboxylase biotin carboxyl carrier protein [Anoxybacillus mongoliensis]
MLKIQEIRELIRLVNESNIVEFVYEHDGSKIKMKKAGAAEQVVVATPKVDVPQTSVVQQQPPVTPVVEKVEVKEEAKPEKQVVATENLHTITSPMVGTFYAAPSPDAAPYVKVGDKVKKDTIVCIVEAMKLFNEIEAEVDGEIVEVLVKNGQLVEYGQPLFLVKPE